LENERNEKLKLKETLEAHYKELTAQLEKCDRTYKDIDSRLRHTDVKCHKIIEKSQEVDQRYERSCPSKKNLLQLSAGKPNRMELNLKT
jgi:ferritin-like metal-binding protein YciE